MRHIDCARSYGKSEEFLSEWLRARNLSPGDVVVTSKWGYSYTAGWRVDTNGEPHEVKEHTPANAKRQSEETAALLGEYVRVYQVHSATLDSGFLDDDLLATLAAIRDTRGWRIGLTLSGTAQADTLRQALARAPGLFSCVQATWNVLEQSAGAALLEARGAGVDVIVKEAMANGRALRSPPLAAAAARLGCTPDALAMAAVLAQPFTPVVLSGAATPEHAVSNAQCVSVAKQLAGDPAVLEKLLDECRQQPDACVTWASLRLLNHPPFHHVCSHATMRTNLATKTLLDSLTTACARALMPFGKT